MKSAKAFVVKEGKLLLTKRIIKGQTDYNLPGGRKKDNESDKMALVRELREELFLDADIGGYLGSYSFTRIVDNEIVDCAVYKCSIKNDPLIKDNSILEMVWVSKQDAIRLTKDELREFILKQAF